MQCCGNWDFRSWSEVRDVSKLVLSTFRTDSWLMKGVLAMGDSVERESNCLILYLSLKTKARSLSDPS